MVHVLFCAGIIGDFTAFAAIRVQVARGIDQGVVCGVLFQCGGINFYAEARGFGDAVKAALNFDCGFYELMLPDIHTRNGRPFGLGEDRTQMRCPGCCDARADELQPEGFVPLFAYGCLFEEARGACTDDKTISDIFFHGRFNRWIVVVHGNGPRDQISDLLVARHVVLWNRRFDHRDFGIGFQFPKMWDCIGGVGEGAVVVQVEVKTGWNYFLNSLDGRVQVKPGAGFEFRTGVSRFDSLSAFFCPSFGWHVHIPPRYGTPVAHFCAQQTVYGYALRFCYGIKQSHLNASTQAIIPHQFSRRSADDFVFDIARYFGPGIVGYGFTPSLNAIFERDMANLVYSPVGKPVAEVFLAVWREGHVEIDEFNGFNFHIYLQKS